MDKKIFAGLIRFEDFQDVFWVVGSRVVVAHARQIRITVTHVQLIGTTAAVARQRTSAGCGSTGARRTVNGFIARRFSAIYIFNRYFDVSGKEP